MGWGVEWRRVSKRGVGEGIRGKVRERSDEKGEEKKGQEMGGEGKGKNGGCGKAKLKKACEVRTERWLTG